MKKLLVTIFALVLVFCLCACQKDDTASTDNSSVPSSSDAAASDVSSESDSSAEDEGSQGLDIPYSSVVEGYINHTTIWESKTVRFKGYECMSDEYLFLPANSIITCVSEYSVYPYKVSGEDLVLDTERVEKMGQSMNAEGDVQRNRGEFTLDEDIIVRFSVRGKLDDVNIYVPKELESEVRLGTEEDFVK